MKLPTLMSQNRVRLDDIVIRDRLRPVSAAGVAALVASINETGVMKDAIHVRKKKDGKLHLVAGGHRVAAARELGWQDIEAKVWTDVTDDWARLMEIDDNLAGAEMTALDNAVFLARRKEVYERLHPEAKAVMGAALAAKRWSSDASDIVSFASATAEKFGISKRHVERMIAAGSKLDPHDIHQLRHAPRPVTLKDLGEIAKIQEAPDRYDVVKALAEGRAKSAAEARRALKPGPLTPPKDLVEDQFKALLNAWNRAGAASRKRFLLEMRHEVWDAQNRGAALPNWAEAADE